MESSLTGSRLSADNMGETGAVKFHQIRAIKLSEIVEEHMVNAKNYVLISDIEGAETDIFYMDSRALLKCKIIICELDKVEGHSISDQVKKLSSLGFVLKEHFGQVYVFKKEV